MLAQRVVAALLYRTLEELAHDGGAGNARAFPPTAKHYRQSIRQNA
ncbi:MAG: hypothetical protein U5M23_16290 [Marinagarivorans sp.]|nr:hypothetical protein [Marinagarivorans sp.]